jgi:hypothetical protein
MTMAHILHSRVTVDYEISSELKFRKAQTHRHARLSHQGEPEQIQQLKIIVTELARPRPVPQQDQARDRWTGRRAHMTPPRSLQVQLPSLPMVRVSKAGAWGK